MGSDDEDLEFLRLAALKSRKRKLENCNTAGSVTLQNNSYKKYDGNNKNFKRNKTLKGHRVGRGGINRNVSLITFYFILYCNFIKINNLYLCT